MKPKMLLGSAALTIATLVLSTLAGVTVTSDLATDSLKEEATKRLIVQRDIQHDRIQDYFDQITLEVGQQASMQGLFTQALNEFIDVFPGFVKQVQGQQEEFDLSVKKFYDEKFSSRYLERNSADGLLNSNSILDRMDDNAKALQHYYVAANPFPLGSKQELNLPEGINSDFSFVHSKYHPQFTDYLNRHGFYDLFLVDAESGNLVYSVFKELDFATSLKTGPYANSAIGEAFRKALKSSKPGETFTTDLKPYYPSYNDFASFVSSAIFVEGKIKGVFIIQIPVDKINQLMTFNNQWSEYGLGDSGETYIVADDKTMRNDSRFLIENKDAYFKALRKAGFSDTVLEEIARKGTTIGIQMVNSPGVNAGLAGETGFNIFPDYRNLQVLSAYKPLEIAGVNWVLLAEIDESEAFAAVNSMTDSILQTAMLVGLMILLTALLASLLFVNSIVSPISHFKQTIDRFAKGDSNARVKLTSDDEIGELATAFDSLLDEREQVLEKINKDNEALNDSVINMLLVAAQLSQGDLTVRMEVAEDVTGPLADSLNMVTDRTGNVISQVRGTALQVENAANAVKMQSDTVKQVSEEELAVVNLAVKDLSLASEELNNIVELARQCNEVADETIKITDTAQESVSESVKGINNIRENIRETEKRIKRLGERSQEIGGIVDLINGIAEKTHVLALNASMQAASAGEAGRGFAVVANEVQRLAENAREATMEISQQVKNIQADTANTVAAMNKAIGQVVEGSQLAEKGSELMDATRDKSHGLVKLVQQIANRSENQAEVAWSLQKQAGEIQKTNAQTFEQMITQTRHTEQLVQSAAELLNAINEFKVEENSSERKTI